MNTTCMCFLTRTAAHFSEGPGLETEELSYSNFERLVNRRQRAKISTATRIAAAMFKHFRINDRLEKLGCDPSNTPILICNRYANWDYVADSMYEDVALTLDHVNNYVATAWFPATIQGYLTIEYENTGEAVTLATTDTEIIVAAIQSLFARDIANTPNGAVIFGTFECLPGQIGTQRIANIRPGAFGAISLLLANDNEESIRAAACKHQELYNDILC